MRVLLFEWGGENYTINKGVFCGQWFQKFDFTFDSKQRLYVQNVLGLNWMNIKNARRLYKCTVYEIVCLGTTNVGMPRSVLLTSRLQCIRK